MQTHQRRISASFNRLLGSVVLLFAVSMVSLPSHAMLIFDFEFGGVKGQVFGLSEGQSMATSVVVSDALGGSAFPIEFVTDPICANCSNRWLVEDGEINPLQSRFFTNVSVPIAGGLFRTSNLLLENGRSFFAQSTSGFPTDVIIDVGGASFSVAPPSTAVPEPSPIALLGAGAIAFGMLRRKKRKLVE